MSHVLIPTARHNSGRRCHLPADDDPAKPKCGADSRSETTFRRVAEDHALARDRPVCKRCAGTVERPETRRPSLRELVNAGDVDGDEVFSDG